MTHVGRLLTVLLLGLGAAFTVQPAHAAEAIEAYEAKTIVEPDGALRVTATVTPGEAGPEQFEQTFTLHEEIADLREYRYMVENVEITSDGRPSGEVTKQDSDVLTATMRSRDGKPIQLSYVVRGAATRDEGGATLVHWNVLQGLDVGVTDFRGQLVIPAMFQDFKCNAGAPGGQASCRAAQGFPQMGGSPEFLDGPRAAGEVVGFRMLFDPAAVAPNEMIIEQWSVGRAFRASGWPLVAALSTLFVGVLVLYLLHRRAGADEDSRGEVERIAEFKPTGEGESMFVLRQEIRPGQVGTLADERVDPVDVTASVIDLAVRGHLRIRELPREGRFSGGDWEIERRDDADDAELLPYEMALLEGLTREDGAPLRVSQISEVSGVIPQVQSLLYDEMVRQGWYEYRPDATRNRWSVVAVVGAVVGIVGTAVLAAFTSFGLTGLAALVVALGLAYVATEMPARTAKGSRALQGLAMLGSELRAHDTDEMPKGREYAELSKVLPYAIVLGGRERWLKAIVTADDDDDADPADLDWFHAPDDWHLRDLPDSLHNLVVHLEGELFSR